jgi:hypothetical protein
MGATVLAVGALSVLVGSPPPDEEAEEIPDVPASSGSATIAIPDPPGERDEYGHRLALSLRDAGQMTTLGDLVREGAQPGSHHVEQANEIVGKMATATSAVEDISLRSELLMHAAEVTQVLETLVDADVPTLPADEQAKAAESFSSAAGAIRRAMPITQLPEQHSQSVC